MAGLEKFNIDNVVVGAFGCEVITDTAEHVGAFQAIQVLEEATLSAITMENLTGTLTGIALPVGAVIFGKMTSITLSGGKVIAYKQR